MQISSVSTFEYISLVGHYNKLTLNKTIDPRLLSRGYSEEALNKMMDKMGKGPSELISLDVHFKSGLDQYNFPYFGYCLTLYDAYSRLSILPFPGSLSDQPAKIIEIFDVLDRLKIEREQKIQEEHERNMKKQRKK